MSSTQAQAKLNAIDAKIDANRRALMSRIHCDPGLSCQAWQNAWDRCPDLRKREDALYAQRYDAQVARDSAASREHSAQERRKRVAYRKRSEALRSCLRARLAVAISQADNRHCPEGYGNEIDHPEASDWSVWIADAVLREIGSAA